MNRHEGPQLNGLEFSPAEKAELQIAFVDLGFNTDPRMLERTVENVLLSVVQAALPNSAYSPKMLRVLELLEKIEAPMDVRMSELL